MPYYMHTVAGNALNRDVWVKLASATLRYGSAVESLNIEPLRDLLSETVIYESQRVLNPLVGRDAVIDYLQGKFQALTAANIAYNFVGGVVDLPSGQNTPCLIILRDGAREGLVVLTLDDADEVSRVDLISVAPRPQEARFADLSDPAGHVRYDG